MILRGISGKANQFVGRRNPPLVQLRFIPLFKGGKLFHLPRLIPAIVLLLSVWVEAYATARGAIGSSSACGGQGEISSLREITIESIWNNPQAFVGKKVLVRGRYLGWRAQIEHPLITRSDWAIADDTGAIYVTGRRAQGLHPSRDIGHPVEVLGTVGVNPKGIPYIRAESVMVIHAKPPKEGVTTVTKGDIGKTIEVRVNALFQIELHGTPTTGFWWHFEALDGEYVEVMKEHTKKASSKGIDGAPVLGIWQLRAKKAGKTIIKMAYYRSWEGGDKAHDQFWISLRITP